MALSSSKPSGRPQTTSAFGRRVTRSEPIRDQAHLLSRLAELVPLIAGHLPATTAAATA
jgi:hypothetical protein